MTDTLPLEFPTLRPASGDTIQERFTSFHEANPWVYDALHSLTLDLLQRGHSKVGVGMLFEILRWRWATTTTDPSSGFKLNNSYRSRYARLLDAEFPGVFETRELSAA